MKPTGPDFASRAGAKLDHALDAFGLSISGWRCADFGSSTGGFVDCLLRRGAARVYAIDRGYGVLTLALRKDPRVIVMERTDARHVHLPEPVDLVTIDAGWTRQREILPAARRTIRDDGHIVTLVKPHYEADPTRLENGVLSDEHTEQVLAGVRECLEPVGLVQAGETWSPVRGRGGNREALWHLRPAGPLPGRSMPAAR